MTPEMWLDLEPIHTVATRISPQIARIPRGFSTVLPCSLLAWHSRSTPELVCHLPSRGLVPRLGGWGTKIFQVSAVGHGRRVLGRLGLRGPDESDLPVKHMATKRLGAALSAG